MKGKKEARIKLIYLTNEGKKFNGVLLENESGTKWVYPTIEVLRMLKLGNCQYELDKDGKIVSIENISHSGEEISTSPSFVPRSNHLSTSPEDIVTKMDLELKKERNKNAGVSISYALQMFLAGKIKEEQIYEKAKGFYNMIEDVSKGIKLPKKEDWDVGIDSEGYL